MNKKDIKEVLKTFKKQTGLSVEDGKRYILNSSLGLLHVSIRLESIGSVFTRLETLTNNHMFRNYSLYSGKQNYHSLEAVEYFLNYVCVVDDITAIAEKVA